MKQIKTRNIRLLAPAVLLLIASASCSDDMQPEPSGESVPVQVSAGLDGGIRETRAVTTVTSGSMGVFVGSANGYVPQYNIQYTNSGSGWEASAPVYVVDEAVSLCAYYPYGAATFAANSTTATLTAQQYDATKDMYYATTGGDAVCNTTPQASFTMTWAYSRLTFSLSRNDYYPSACKVSQIVIAPGSGTFYTASTIDIATGTVTGSTTAANYTIDTSALSAASGIAQGATDTSVDLLFPPQTCSGLKLTLTVDGKDLSVTIPADKFTGFTAGSRYTVEVAISGAGVSAVTIPSGWTDETVNNGGTEFAPLP